MGSLIQNGSLIHWLIGWLIDWFIDSLAHWLVASLGHCFATSLIYWFMSSLLHSFFHWFIDFLVHWFIHSVVHRFFMTFHWHLNHHFLMHWCTSELQHFIAALKNLSIGHGFPIAMSYVRNFCTGVCWALSGNCVKTDPLRHFLWPRVAHCWIYHLTWHLTIGNLN